MCNNTIQKPKGIVFFDVDGTLVDERANIFRPTEVTKKSIQKLKENGYLTGIATGRAKCYLPDFGIDFDCYVTSNGAVAEYNGKVVANSTIEKEKALELIKYFEDRDIAYNCECHNKCGYGEKNFDKLKKMFDVFDIDYMDFQPLNINEDLKINKLICVFDKSETFDEIKNDLKADFTITRHHENNSADVDLNGINKSVGVAALVDYFGLDIKDSYAFGDDGNDVDMLKKVGCGIAMTPHAAVLDDAADMFTVGVAEEGIYKALTELKLI